MDNLAVGVMMSVGWTVDQLKQIENLGFTNAQIASPPEAVLADAGKRQNLINSIQSLGIAITTVFVGFDGESYADIPTVRETVGYLNPNTRESRIQKTRAISDFAKSLGVDKVAAHVGFVPEEAGDQAYAPMVETVGQVADYCSKNGQVFSLETGQESAPALLRYLDDMGKDNVKVNFDPANMILYGSGEPIEALHLLGEQVVSTHAKDGKWPTAEGQLGTEYPLGQGDVGIEKYVEKLKEIGYEGPITIEREIPDWDQKVTDLVEAKQLLESYT